MLLARFFRIVFKIPFFRKRYYAFYTKIFAPLHLFQNQTAIRPYQQNLKIKLHIDEWIQQQIYFLDVFDERGIRFLQNHLNPGDIFLDIGANIGCYTLAASKMVTDTGKVYAFEAISGVFEKLTYNANINKLQNVVLENKAIYSKEDTLTFYVSARENMGMSSIFRHDTESGQTETVKAISVDQYVTEKNIQKINVIKIDIEGAEMFALKGMTKTLQNLKPLVMIELSEDVLPNTTFSKNDVVLFMEDLGYEYKAINTNGMPVNSLDHSDPTYHNYIFFPKIKF